MSLQKDFAKVAGSNVLLLVASSLNNFILPIILSIDDYANYKTYLLYAHFVGFFHLGYVDGINIKYGGMENANVDSRTFWGEHHFFLIFQLLITIIMLGVAIESHSIVMALFALSVMPINMQSFFLFFTQAIGEFNIYAKCVIIVPFILCVTTLVAFAFHSVVDYTFFCIFYLLSYLISWAVLEIRTVRIIPFSKKIYFKALLNNHKTVLCSGFFIMMGTIVFSFFTTTGRWLIKWMMDNDSFAVYSMAASLLGFILVLVNAVNKVFYPYLCKNKDDETKNEKLIYVLLILSTISLSFFFPLKLIILLFLPKYTEAVEILKLLLLTIPAVVIIQSYYINVYKARKMERQYLRDGLLYLAVSFILSFAFFCYFRTLNSIAIANVLSVYIWFFIPNKDIYKHRHILYLLTYFALIFTVYLGVEHFLTNVFISFLISLFGIVILNIIFHKGTLHSFIKR